VQKNVESKVETSMFSEYADDYFNPLMVVSNKEKLSANEVSPLRSKVRTLGILEDKSKE
jgi:hypothetical protein